MNLPKIQITQDICSDRTILKIDGHDITHYVISNKSYVLQIDEFGVKFEEFLGDDLQEKVSEKFYSNVNDAFICDGVLYLKNGFSTQEITL